MNFEAPSSSQEKKNIPQKFTLNEWREKAKKYILLNIVKPDELRAKAIEASRQKWIDHQHAVDKFEAEPYYDSNSIGAFALNDLSSETKKDVWAHGIDRGSKEDKVNALIAILCTGVLKGDSAPLEGGHHPTFTSAPFVLLSNKGESLAMYNDDKSEFQLRNLRTVLVNGEFEAIVQDLRDAFPGVSFRTADQIDDRVFETKSAPFHSWADRAKEMADKKFQQQES